ncbi:MAG: purine phosphorylase [Hyphococcus sp.]|nr:MAG: purine phosphorylase [Marinicaulis sp.]
MTGFVGVICGLKSEAQAVASTGEQSKLRIGVSGANASRAEELAAEFCEVGASAILSVGVSGGLDPALKPGDLVIGERVIADEGSVWTADSYLTGILKEEIEQSAAKMGALFGSDQIIDSAQRKAALFQNHNALAVDMESHGAARAAVHMGVPFLAIRAIADPAGRALPPAALGAVAPDGSTRAFKTLGAALRDPKQFPELMKLGADSAAATKTLRRDLGPIFCRLFLGLDL